MNPSLSVILPVCNAEECLRRVVGSLLDTLPDVAVGFEILLVDDASTDHSAEIADELRRAYPQVRVVRHGWSWGTSAAVRTGRLASRGKHVIVVSALEEFQPRDIVRQWASLKSPSASSEGSVTADDSRQTPILRRTESAHGESRRQREPSFLRHLRQLSDVM